MGDCSVSRNAQEAIHLALSRGPATKDASEGNEGPPLGLDTGEQQEILESQREILSLLNRDDNALSLIADIQVRTAVMFNPCLSGCHPRPLHLGCSQSPE